MCLAGGLHVTVLTMEEGARHALGACDDAAKKFRYRFARHAPDMAVNIHALRAELHMRIEPRVLRHPRPCGSSVSQTSVLLVGQGCRDKRKSRSWRSPLVRYCATDPSRRRGGVRRMLAQAEGKVVGVDEVLSAHR